MKVTYENDMIVFDISQGPAAIIEALNARGKDGWVTTATVNVSGEKIVFFLAKGKYILPDKASDKEKELNKLWG
jgi:hypothetical protein